MRGIFVPMARAPEYQPGQQIPGTVYKVLKVLGQGGMGTVYEVEDTTLGKRYVLKTLQADLADRKDLAERLGREARTLAKLQHPCIVEVFTSGRTGDTGLPFYVMERLQGVTLRGALQQKGRVSFEQACDIGIDLLDALDHAHGAGIIHRDVKPDNIFLTTQRDGRSVAKLLDFGIIKLAASVPGASLHTGSQFVGTFRYAAPEQVSCREITPRSDLYSAGLVLYEMVAGRGPFDDIRGEMEVGRAHTQIAPPPLDRYADVPPAFVDLVMMALQKEPRDRPADAFTFGRGLRAFKLGGPSPNVVSARTVDQLVPPPMSRAQPVAPFGDASEAVTRHAPEVPTQANLSHTLSMGVVNIPPPETVAAAPVTAAMAMPVQLVDRSAETRAAAPQLAPAPNNDTAPIPLAVLAPSVPPQNETFGAHTTDTSQRRKTARIGVVVAILAACMVCITAAVAISKLRRPTEVAEPRTQSLDLAVVPQALPTPQPTESTAIAPLAEPTTEPTPSQVETTVRHAASGSPHVTRHTDPPAASSAAPASHHRVGSGLD